MKTPQKQSKSYIPLPLRNNTSPHFHFEQIYSKEDLQSSDEDDDYYDDEELLQRQNKFKKQRRKAIQDQSNFGFKAEDYLNLELSPMIAKIADNQDNMQENQFSFKDHRVTVLNDLKLVKDQIQKQQLSQQQILNKQQQLLQQSQIFQAQNKSHQLDGSISKQNNSDDQKEQEEPEDNPFNMDFFTKIKKKKIKKKKKNKEKKQFDEDQIHHFNLKQLYDFIEYKYIDEGENVFKPQLRVIYLIYKHPHLYHSALKISEFYIPVYESIENKKAAQDEFLDWKDYAAKHMEIRGNNGDYIYSSYGLDIQGFNEFPPDEKIFIIQGTKPLIFWLQFQRNYGLQLNYIQQKEYIQFLNSLPSKEQILQNLISITQIEKKLLEKEAEREIKKAKLQMLKNSKRYSLPKLFPKVDLSSDQQNQIDQSKLRFKKLPEFTQSLTNNNVGEATADQTSQQYQQQQLSLQQQQLQELMQSQSQSQVINDNLSMISKQQTYEEISMKQTKQSTKYMTMSMNNDPMLFKSTKTTTTFRKFKKPNKNEKDKFFQTIDSKKKLTMTQKIENMSSQHLKACFPEPSPKQYFSQRQIQSIYTKYNNILKFKQRKQQSPEQVILGSINRQFSKLKKNIIMYGLPIIAQQEEQKGQSFFFDDLMVIKKEQNANDMKKKQANKKFGKKVNKSSQQINDKKKITIQISNRDIPEVVQDENNQPNIYESTQTEFAEYAQNQQQQQNIILE